MSSSVRRPFSSVSTDPTQDVPEVHPVTTRVNLKPDSYGSPHHAPWSTPSLSHWQDWPSTPGANIYTQNHPPWRCRTEITTLFVIRQCLPVPPIARLLTCGMGNGYFGLHLSFKPHFRMTVGVCKEFSTCVWCKGHGVL